MKIYTKGGDKGTTALFGGKRVSKAHARIDAYGTVDELNSWIGVVKDHLPEHRQAIMLGIQNRLFTVGAILAAEPGKANLKLPSLTEEDVKILEDDIDSMEQTLPPLKAFVLPGGDESASFCHVARTVCRRAERATVLLSEEEGVQEEVLIYLNRLSDHLFVLSRWILAQKGKPDVEWHPTN